MNSCAGRALWSRTPDMKSSRQSCMASLRRSVADLRALSAVFRLLYRQKDTARVHAQVALLLCHVCLLQGIRQLWNVINLGTAVHDLAHVCGGFHVGLSLLSVGKYTETGSKRVHAQFDGMTLWRSAGTCRCVQTAARALRQLGCKKVRWQGFSASWSLSHTWHEGEA